MTSETTIGTDESTIMTFSPADYRDRVLIADGDYQLEAVLRGWPRGTATAEMSLSRPDIATAVAGAFLDAGSDLLVTPTSTANLLARDVALAGEQAGFEKFAELNRRWARLCRDAVSQSQAAKRWVLGAVGPPARLLLLREIERGQVIEAYEQQIAALRDGGVDGIVCRGFTELDALVMAVEAAEAFGLPIIGCMAFDGGPSRTETTLGVTAMQAGAALEAAGAAAAGLDGGENPDGAAGVVSLLRKSCGLPLWAAVDAGQPQLVEGRVEYPEEPAAFASRLAPLVSAGASVVAGGRGVRAAHVAALSSEREKLSPRSGRTRK